MMTKAETSKRILSAYIALIVVAFAGQVFILGLAAVYPIRLAPWLVLQLMLIPLAALAGWYFDSWVSFLERPLIQHIRERPLRSETVQANPSEDEASDVLTETERQLRSEIRKLSEPDAS